MKTDQSHGDLREKVAQSLFESFWARCDEHDPGALTDQPEEIASTWRGMAEDVLNLIGGDGWKLVPVEPTEEMLSVVHKTWRGELAWNYRAMIAASPPPPVTP
jgi:hypothetical protein